MLTINNTLDGYLKDVEILGNTIQDASNLADIRSVGDTVEGQELYEIPVLSVGKNLFDGKLELGYYSNGNPANGNNIRSVNFIKVKPNTNYSYVIKNANTNIWSVQYDKDLNFIKNSYNSFITDANCSYIKFYTENSGISSSINTIQIQVEEGTQATPYEPYVEDKLTILSPVQLERVGDVADRIICKDGVWGVEKNNVAGVIQLPHIIALIDTIETFTGVVLHIPDVKHSNRAFNILIEGLQTYTGDISNALPYYVYANTGNHVACFPKGTSMEDMKNYLIGKKYICVATNSTFIPLPHSQQIKLRTFANKTNISFLTEIEGTIKAQVPKSLGATVNTHTEQISNLNKELDRVKKLEESTVSTVTTESDFTTVEATSNGYFEDVKLEGRTLVNLVYGSRAGNSWLEITALRYDITGKTVTVINNSDKKISFQLSLLDGSYYAGSIVNPYSSRVFNVSQEHKFRMIQGRYEVGWTSDELDKFKKSVLILEGDHTQNPPSYFEGLKSVGDATDEIVVSSVNENLFSNQYENTEYYINSTGGKVSVTPGEEKYRTSIKVAPNTTYTSICTQTIPSSHIRYCEYDKNGNFIQRNLHTVSNSTSYIFTTSPNTSYIDIYYEVALLGLIQLERGTQTTEYTPHQADKKRLLYYNNETQAWEKPILRQWDSVEKHSDGKYYYHQRSGEVVLNGSESWGLINTGVNTTLFLCISNILAPTGDTTVRTISDRIPGNSFANRTTDIEMIYTHNNEFAIRILNTKLSSQDVQGFKQWLQANNVTVVYQLAQEKVYECTNIDLITYANETNYIVECGAIVPRSTLKVHNNISNVVSLLQKKVSLLESNVTSYIITQNRLQLASTYSADSVTFKVDYFAKKSVSSYDNDLFNLILSNILVGKENYDYDKMFNIIMDYASWSQISWDQFDILVEMMDLQHNPPIELPTEEFPEETPEE